MIVLSSPSPRKLSLYSSIGCGILAALGIVFTGVVAFTQLPEAWQNPDRSELCWVILQIGMGLIGISAAAWQITQQLTVGDPRQCLVATEETLAIKTVNKPMLFLKRRDCIALALEGKALVMADGTIHAFQVYGTKADNIEAFIDSLYELWWPGLNRAEVRQYLTAITPPRSKWRMLPLYRFLIPVLFVASVYMWESIWIPIALFGITMICFALLSARVLLQRAREEESLLYPLVDSDEVVHDAEWYGAYVQVE